MGEGKHVPDRVTDDGTFIKGQTFNKHKLSGAVMGGIGADGENPVGGIRYTYEYTPDPRYNRDNRYEIGGAAVFTEGLPALDFTGAQIGRPHGSRFFGGAMVGFSIQPDEEQHVMPILTVMGGMDLTDNGDARGEIRLGLGGASGMLTGAGTIEESAGLQPCLTIHIGDNRHRLRQCLAVGLRGVGTALSYDHRF